jgi:protein TonB
MPRDLFGDVVRPPASIGSRKWYTLPISFVFHTVILALVIVVPLMATGVLPTPSAGGIEWTQVTAVEPPSVPPPARQKPATPVPASMAANPDAAPLEAPSGVREETGVIPVEAARGVEGGVPEGVMGEITNGLPEAPAPAPPATPAAPIRLHSGIQAPAKIHHVAPIYPAIAVAARRDGTVILEAIIAIDGTVTSLRVLRSVPLLDDAAMDAVRQWRFTPTRLNGQPVAVVMTVTVTFTLK